jgi:hypothetical protein
MTVPTQDNATRNMLTVIYASSGIRSRDTSVTKFKDNTWRGASVVSTSQFNIVAMFVLMTTAKNRSINLSFSEILGSHGAEFRYE